MACRYPQCASQLSSDCSKTRIEKREFRFQTWTCKHCIEVKPQLKTPADRVHDADPVWYQNFEELQKYYKGNQSVPLSTNLKEWLRINQNFRKRFSKDKQYLLHQVTESRQESAKRKVHQTDPDWYENWEALQKRCTEAGRTPVQRTPLGKWLNSQESRPDYLSKEKKLLLHSLSFFSRADAEQM